MYFLLAPDEQRQVRKIAVPLAFALVQEEKTAGNN